MPSKKSKKIKFQDRIRDILIQKLEQASIRDIAFLTSWVAGTYIAYKGINLVDTISFDIPDIISDWIFDMLNIPGAKLEGDEKKEVKLLHIAIAMIASYKLLTSETEDIMSALSLVTGQVSGLMPKTP